MPKKVTDFIPATVPNLSGSEILYLADLGMSPADRSLTLSILASWLGASGMSGGGLVLGGALSGVTTLATSGAVTLGSTLSVVGAAVVSGDPGGTEGLRTAGGFRADMASGSNRSLIASGISGLTAGFTVNYTHATTSMVYVFTASGSASTFTVVPNAIFSSTLSVAGATKLAAVLQVTGTGTPASGSGLELVGGATPYMQAYNRDGAAYVPMNLYASTFAFNPSVSGSVSISNTAAVTLSSTLSVAGAVTLASDPAANSIITVGGSATADRATKINLVASNTQKNWQVAVNQYTAGSFSITPSTAGGGSTFTSPMVELTATGATLSGTLSVTGAAAVGGATVSASTGLITPVGTTALSSLRIPHGAAPTSPVDGDVWSTTTTLNFRLNGVTKSVTLV